MANITLIPGSYSREIDLSFVSSNPVQDNVYSVVGFTQKGQAFVPTRIDSYSDFVDDFGGLHTDYVLPYAAKNILKNQTSVLVTKILGTDATLALNNYIPLVFSTTSLTGATISSLSGKVLGILRFRETLTGTPSVGFTGTATAFTLSITGTGLTGVDASFSGNANGSITGLSIDPASPNYIAKKLGTDPKNAKNGELLTSVYVDKIYNWYVSSSATDFGETTYNGALTATTTLSTSTANVVSTSNDNTFGAFSEAFTPYVVSQNYDGIVYNLFKFHTFQDGNPSNTAFKISISNVVAGSSSSYAKFTVTIRKYDDTDTRPIVLEQFKDVTLDPNDRNYIAKVIGDTYEYYDTTLNKVKEVGTYVSNSRYVYIEMANNIPIDAEPSGFKSIEYLYPASGKDLVQLPVKKDQLINSEYNKGGFMGIDFDTYGTKLFNLLTAVPTASSSKQALKGFLIMNTSQTSSSASITGTYTTVTLSSTGNARDKQFTVPFYGGWDGIDPTVALSAQQTSLSGAFVNAMNMLADRDLYDFDVFYLAGVNLKALQTKAINLCEERADAYAIVDLGSSTDSVLTVTGQSYYGSYDTSYACGNFPFIKSFDDENEKNITLPAGVGVLEAMAFNDRVAFPWFAAAGENRGIIESAYGVVEAMSRDERAIYEQYNLNPIIKLKGVVQRADQNTLQRKKSALSNENVRRMLIKVRKLITAIASKYVFEPNDSRTWRRFTNEINPILQDVQSKRGIIDFRVVMDETTNTRDKIDRNEMYGKIVLQPTRAAEVFLVDFFVSPTGATFNDI